MEVVMKLKILWKIGHALIYIISFLVTLLALYSVPNFIRESLFVKNIVDKGI